MVRHSKETTSIPFDTTQETKFFKENDNSSKFVKHVSTETSVIFS